MHQAAQAHAGKMNFHAGEAAEQAVARAYERRGCRLVAKRWRGGGGEIDLILRAGDTVIFVEVKKSKSFAQAALRISAAQQRRILAAASVYLSTEPQGMLSEVRFDVALLDRTGEIEIIENALCEG